MDMLEHWGVLSEPEKLGISVEFISPSLLVPKPDPGEYRLVTDFSSLNLHLKKYQTLLPLYRKQKKGLPELGL